MAANFIFEGPDKLRVTSFSSVVHYNIEDLNFYISSRAFPSQVQVFLILKSQSGLYEIVELHKAGTSGQNILYKIPINQTLRITDEETIMQIMVLDYNIPTYYLSNTVKINICTNNYKLARQVYIAQEVGATVQDYYAKIIALSEKLLEKGE